MTYRLFIDDIRVALGMVHDDALWSREPILMNVLYGLNLLGAQDLSRDLTTGDGLQGMHRRRVVCVPVEHISGCNECEWKHSYFELPSETYDLPYDGGITMVRYGKDSGCKPAVAGASFTITSLEHLSGLWDHPYQGPREDRPYVARYMSEDGKDRVGVFGISPLVKKLLVGVFYAPKYETVDLDEEIPLDIHRLHDLKRLVLTMSVWPLGLPQERYKNDGRDFEPDTVINTRPLISLNDPILNSGVKPVE